MNDFDGQNDFQRSFARMGENSFFNERFRSGGMTYEATGIDEIDAATKVALGGELASATTTIYVTTNTMKEAAITEQTEIFARGKKLSVIKIGRNGASGYILFCGGVEKATL